MVQAWVSDLERRGLSPETIRGHFSLLAAILGRAVAKGLIARAPTADVELPRIHRRERRFLTAEQVEKLADAHPERYRVLVLVAAYMGLRWEEAAGLLRDSIDMRPGRPGLLTVRRSLARARGRYHLSDHVKSEAAWRTLKMPAFLREELAAHLNHSTRDETDAWVFTAPAGGHLRYDNFRQRVWIPSTRRANLELTFHELRHTAAAFMIDEGGDPLQVTRRMGHADVRTTFNLYGHLFPDREDELVAALDRRRAAAREANGDQMGTNRGPSVSELAVKTTEKTV